jgi:DNA invertase Pin-like site-specific DNA recombinase
MLRSLFFYPENSVHNIWNIAQSPQISGWAIDRPGWKECKGYLHEGDTLHVHSIDRLARNLEDLQRTVRELTERGITIKFVKEGLTFQGQADPFQVLMFQMVGAFAQFERSMIKERQREGIAKAKAEGKFRARHERVIWSYHLPAIFPLAVT